MRSIGNGRYQLIRRIAAGGMGEVWQATDTALGRTVAVKLLHPSLADDATFRRRFATEARNAAALHDPTIATIFDYGDDVDAETGRHTAYLVMEYVDGAPLSDLLTGPLPPGRAAALIAQAADGLAVAHGAGIVHRDVKPANFLVTPADKVKVTDFGIARARGASALTESGTVLATPFYVAPEVAAGEEATYASDLYSLGVVLYECLSGHRPFAADTPVAVALAHVRDKPPPLPVSVPAPLAALVQSAMSKDPAQRPPSAAQFAAALRSAAAAGKDGGGVLVEASAATTVLPAAGAATRVLPAGSVEPSLERRRRLWPLVAAAAVLLIGAALGWAALTGGNSGAAAGEPSATSGPTRPTGSPAPSRTTSSAGAATKSTPTSPPKPPAIRVVAADYIGMSKQSAEAQLKALGLEVTSTPVPGGQRDIVADISPTGMLALHRQVTLFVHTGFDSGPGHGNPPGHGEQHDHGKPKDTKDHGSKGKG